MRRVVWKFPLQMRGWNLIGIGPEAKVVLTGIDPESGAPTIWVEHDPEQMIETDKGRAFGVFPTGGTLAADADHVGSMIDRTFVWHIYERRP
jgi:hypothetical protein